MKFAMYTGFSSKVQEEGIECAAEYAVQLGFSAVEFFADCVCEADPGILSMESAKHAREVLERHHLQTACYSVYADLWKNPEGEKRVMEQVQVAAALGAPYLHHTLLPWLTLSEEAPGYEEAMEGIVEIAGRIADYADTFGITCIYEDQGYYVNGVNGFQGFWDRMKKRCKNVGICGDLGNILFADEMPEDFLQVFIEDVRHVHVKDYLRKKAVMSPGKYWVKAKEDIWLRDTMVGNGIIDFETCMTMLKNAGYQGYFALESLHPEPYEAGVEQAMEYLSRFW